MVRFVFIVSFVNSLIQGLKEFSGLHKQRNYQVQLVKTCPNVKSFTVKHFWVANIFVLVFGDGVLYVRTDT